MKCSAQQMASINSNRRLINSEMGQDNIFQFQDWINWKISTNPWLVQQFEKNFQIHLDYSCLSTTTTTRKNYANCCWLWRRECTVLVSVSSCFTEKLQTSIFIFSKKPNQIESQYFHQHQILRLFTVCMKPWWNQGLSYSYDKPCRQHSKPINFDKSWNIFLNS